MSSPDLNNTAAAILGLLRDGPLAGWDVAVAAEAFFGEFWNTTRSQVYRELEGLAQRGLVRAGERGKRDRRPYELTTAGLAAFRSWLRSPPDRDVVRIPLLLKLSLGEDLPSSTKKKLLRDYRETHSELLAQYRARLQELERSLPHVADVVRYGIAHEEAVLRWVDRLLSDRR